MNSIPNFFIVGATKSGTTSLHDYLSQHPDIYMSENKEPHYFSKNDIVPYYGPGDEYIQKSMFQLDEYDYFKNFVKKNEEKITGESSAMYLYYKSTAQEIYSFNKDAKILILLRNPADRAFSAFMHMRRDGRENCSEFSEALEEENIRKGLSWMPIWYYKELGYYYEQVNRYIDLFGCENVKIDIFEEARTDWNAYLREVCEFLEVDEKFIFDTSSISNVSGIPRMQLLHQILRKRNVFSIISRFFFSKKVRTNIKNAITNLNISKSESLGELERDYLKEVYLDDINKLSKLIKKDLSIWL